MEKTKKIGVIGAGSWGMALAMLLADIGHEVTIWAYEPECVKAINEDRENTLFLPGIPIPKSFKLKATSSLQETCEGKDAIVVVTPSHVTRKVMLQALPFLPSAVPIVSCSKGIENESLQTLSEVFEDILPIRFHPYLSYLSGPSFAREVANKMPTVVVVAAFSEKLALMVQKLFTSSYFRVYRSTDVVGVELGGALKNVIAIAAGAADGMGFGHNSRAGLITRGLAEISRMAVARGANPLTLAGLAGMGDLVLTCTGGLSRNRAVGVKLGEGLSLQEILAEMNMVAEGIKTAKSVYHLAKKMNVDMPISEQVYNALYKGKPVAQALVELMSRELKRESFGF